MKCISCGRKLAHPVRTIQTESGVVGWGRVCAVKAGLLTPVLRGIFTPAKKQPEPDPNQLTLDLRRRPPPQTTARPPWESPLRSLAFSPSRATCSSSGPPTPWAARRPSACAASWATCWPAQGRGQCSSPRSHQCRRRPRPRLEPCRLVGKDLRSPFEGSPVALATAFEGVSGACNQPMRAPHKPENTPRTHPHEPATCGV